MPDMIHLLAALVITLSSNPAYAAFREIPMTGITAIPAFLLLENLGARNSSDIMSDGPQLAIKEVDCSVQQPQECTLGIYQGMAGTLTGTATPAQSRALVRLLAQAGVAASPNGRIFAQWVLCSHNPATPELNGESTTNYRCTVIVPSP